MKRAEIREILDKLEKKIDVIGNEAGYTEGHSYKYGYFSSAITNMLDELLTDKQVSTLYNLVNKY